MCAGGAWAVWGWFLLSCSCVVSMLFSKYLSVAAWRHWRRGPAGGGLYGANSHVDRVSFSPVLLVFMNLCTGLLVVDGGSCGGRRCAAAASACLVGVRVGPLQGEVALGDAPLAQPSRDDLRGRRKHGAAPV